MDITIFMSDFLDLFISIFTKSFKFLNSISFGGITLLQYIITINVLGAVVLLLFTIVSNYSVSSSRAYAASEKRKAERSVRRRG